jgi:hypothetical protein
MPRWISMNSRPRYPKQIADTGASLRRPPGQRPTRPGSGQTTSSGCRRSVRREIAECRHTARGSHLPRLNQTGSRPRIVTERSPALLVVSSWRTRRRPDSTPELAIDSLLADLLGSDEDACSMCDDPDTPSQHWPYRPEVSRPRSRPDGHQEGIHREIHTQVNPESTLGADPPDRPLTILFSHSLRSFRIGSLDVRLWSFSFQRGTRRHQPRA